MTEWLLSACAAVNDVLWGPVTLVFLVGVGLYLTLRTGFFQIRRFPTAVKKTLAPPPRADNGRKKSSGITPMQALTTALSGTLGTGSMAGVAIAITLGGPGSMLWMALSAIVGMMTKYAEITLAVHFRAREKDGSFLGGPMVTLERGLGSRKAGVLYAFFGLCASFGVGNIAQANTLAQVVSHASGAPQLAVGIVAAILVALVIIGGVKRIAHVTVRVVPAMSLIYILSGLLVLAINWKALPGTISLILRDAFGLRAIAGGAAGAGVRSALRYGVARGVFSNEAGMGSAAIAHSSAETPHPADQGLWGILEVAIDTLLVCMMSGLVILAAGQWESGLTGSALLAASFSGTFGAAGQWMVALSLAAFAFATFLGWSHYGAQCIRYLGGERLVPAYRVFFSALIVAGSVMGLELAWAVSDIFNALMIFPNLICVVLLSPVLLKITRERFGK